MPDSTNPRRQWFRYTANDGTTHFAVKVDRNWGANSDSGLVAYGGGGPAFGADPLFPRTGRNRLRMGIGENPDSFQKTRWVVGTTTAAAGAGDYVFVSSAKGIAGAVNYNLIGVQDEHIMKAHNISAAPEVAGV